MGFTKAAPEPASYGRPPAGSGPVVARLFHRLLALNFLAAWVSLGVQIRPLVGSRGLLPAVELIATARAQGRTFADLPTVFWWTQSDGALLGGTVAGAALAILAFAGVAPRLLLAVSTALYLSYATVCRTFLLFQWDNLLLECGLLAAFLPRERPARAAHFVLRVLLFKLYWESGLAKWLSPLGDWQDGSAMTFYYETAPLPTRLAALAHAMPQAWHQVEAWFTLLFELALPFGIFGPRRVRLVAATVFTGFQAVNFATSNYGFFTTLAVALHVLLLDDADLVRWRGRMERRWPLARRLRARVRAAGRAGRAAWRARVERWRTERWVAWIGAARRPAGFALAAAYVGVSALEGMEHFGRPGGAGGVARFRALSAPLRLINTYHLFAAITRERIEPQLEALVGGDFTALDLRYKPGDPARAPAFVAPHQPRLDFQLWFYGLSLRNGPPPYVARLVERLCDDPQAVASFFAGPLPPRPSAVRIAFWSYHFAAAEERRRSGAWWTRTRLGSTKAWDCAR